MPTSPWKKGAPFPEPDEELYGVAANGKLYVIGGWNDGKNLGRILEILWHAGDIAISRREGTQRVWDLFERVLPEADADQIPDEVVAIETMERQLRARGLADPGFGTAIDYELPAQDYFDLAANWAVTEKAPKLSPRSTSRRSPTSSSSC